MRARTSSMLWGSVPARERPGRFTLMIMFLTVAVGFILPTSAVVAALPTSPGGPIDAYAAYEGQSTCDPTPKSGVVGFRDILLADYPGRSLGISRDCSVGGQSEHKEGRALDFAFNANDSTEAAQAATVLNWLLATDAAGNRHALLRRLGIMYVIWNRRVFRAYDSGAGWQAYSGANPHTDHIHFSFSWNGALETTSWSTPAGRWLTPGTADARFHCSAYNNELSPVVFQDCVVVTQAAAGAHAQSVMAVSNPGSTAVRVNGQTTTYLDGGVLIGGACGDIMIAAGGRSWCWGTSSPVAGNGRYVQGQGALRLPGGLWHLAWSPSKPT